jgi:hypothetical protein
MHEPAAHWVPAGASRQAPAPLHIPSVPQATVSTAHWPSGSCPAGTGEQVPALPVTAHERQSPVQVLLQQTFCWQRPDVHSAAAAQAAPLGFLPQLPALQVLGAAQSASAVQEVRQAAAPQAKGAQDEVTAARHIPLPLQTRGAE